VLVLDHYLELLSRRPGALPGSIPLVQARASGGFPAARERFWRRARRRLGDAAATRALIEVLLLHRTLPFVAVHAALDAVERALVRRFDRPAPGLAPYDTLLGEAAS
jgi:hypothetical protein